MNKLPEPAYAEFSTTPLYWGGEPYAIYIMRIYNREYAIKVERFTLVRPWPDYISEVEYEMIKYHYQQKLLHRFWRNLGAA